MNILLYLYDNLLVILYSGACFFAFCNYRKKEKRTSVYIAALFFFILLNQLITSMAEFIPEFARIYHIAYINMPIFNTVISILAAVCLLNLFYLFVPDKRIARYEYIILLAYSLLLLIIPTLKNNPTNLFLYTSVLLLYLLYRGVCLCYLLHRKSPVYPHGSDIRIYNIFSYITMLFAMLGLIESFVKIFYLYLNSDIYSYRIYSMDFLFSIVTAFSIYTYIPREAASQTCEAAISSFESKTTEPASDIHSGTEIGIFYTFCDLYALTPREQTILTEVLNHAAYHQISDKLLISTYTVKTHVHNICKKTAVKSKHELSDLYENYKNSYLS